MPFANKNSYSISEVKHFYSFVGNVIVIAEVYLWHLHTCGCVEICLVNQSLKRHNIEGYVEHLQ
jgi:hypothetical protein